MEEYARNIPLRASSAKHPAKVYALILDPWGAICARESLGARHGSNLPGAAFWLGARDGASPALILCASGGGSDAVAARVDIVSSDSSGTLSPRSPSLPMTSTKRTSIERAAATSREARTLALLDPRQRTRSAGDEVSDTSHVVFDSLTGIHRFSDQEALSWL